MSVRARLVDAQLLYGSGRREGALLMLLVAVAATSRKRYPRPSKKMSKGQKPKITDTDRGAFETFLAHELPRVANIGNWLIKFRGERRPLQSILYEFMRCELAHEAGLPNDVRFEVGDIGGLKVSVTPEHITFSDDLLRRIELMVVNAPENSDLFVANPVIIRAARAGT